MYTLSLLINVELLVIYTLYAYFPQKMPLSGLFCLPIKGHFTSALEVLVL